MKKLLIVLSLLVLALFLVSCAPKEETGEEGALAGQAVKLLKIENYVTEQELTEKVKQIIRDEIEVAEVNGNYYPNKNCDQKCSEIGKKCIIALWGYSGSTSSANFDKAIVKASHSCTWEVGDNNILFCECI